MGTGLSYHDQLVFALILLIVGFVVFIIDCVILVVWLKYRYKRVAFESSFGIVPNAVLPPTVPPLPDLVEHGDASSVWPINGNQALTVEEGSSEALDNPPSMIDDATFIVDHQPPTVIDPASWVHDESLFPGVRTAIRSPFARTWSVVHPFLGFQAIYIVINLLAGIAVVPVALKPNAMNNPYVQWVSILSLIPMNAAFVALTYYLVKSYGTSLSNIELRKPGRRQIVIGLGAGLVLCFAAMLLEQALNAAAPHVVSKHVMDHMERLTKQLTAGGELESMHGWALQLLFVIAAAVAAPIGEEVFFRGLLCDSFKKRWGVKFAVVASAICFGVMHFGPLAIIVIIPMGIVLALVYERTHSLWITILMHSTNNFVQVLIELYAMHHGGPAH